MKNLKRMTAAFLLVISIVISALPVTVEVSAATLVYSTESNSGTRHVVCTTLDGTRVNDYYTGNYTYEGLCDLSQTALLNSLNELMADTHEKNSSYSDCRDMAVKTDCEQNNGKVNLIYSSFVTTRSTFGGSGNVWNREHVWPKSLGGYETSGAGSDLHHIRPSDCKINGTRSNDKYGNVSGGKAVYGSGLVGTSFIGGYRGGGYFEPLDNVKGDVARICLYMYVRYGHDSRYNCDDITTIFQSVEVLLEWCELDPVDTWEMGRNEVVAAYQGNRNVFIDYPEFAWLIFGEEVPAAMTTPSKGASSSTNCEHKTTEIRNASEANCGKEGYTGDTYCKSCGKKLASGTKINPTGNHSFGLWSVNGGVELRTCTVCKATETRSCTHKETEIRNASEANCGVDGYTGDTCCKDCGSTLSTGSKINATGNHSFGEWETNGDKQSRVCSVCNKTEDRAVPACTHESTEIKNAVAPTCGSEGYTGDTCCKDCGTKLGDGEVIAATGDHKNTEYRGAVTPTCAKEGSTGELYCKDCESKLADSEILPVTDEHSNTELRGYKAATCSEEGYSGDTYCNDCGKTVVKGSVIPATEKHNFEDGEITSKPTKTEDGMKIEICKDCGFTQATVIPATGDNTVLIIAVVAGVVLAAAVAVVIIVIVKKKKAE